MTADSLCPIEPLPDETPPARDLGPRPELHWVPPTSLLVDETYQRDLNRRSLALIRRIILHFSWRKLKPIICVRVAAGLHIIDGQHGAIAAATLQIPEIPVWVVHADSPQARADAFVAHNQDRLVMAPLDVYRAQLGGRRADAILIDRVCKAAGVRLKVVSSYSANRVGDTAAIGAIRTLVTRRGSDVAKIILTAFVEAGRAPITTAEISAMEVVMCSPLNTKTPSAADITAAIKSMGPEGIVLAKGKAATDRVPVGQVLVAEYRRRLPRAARQVA